MRFAYLCSDFGVPVFGPNGSSVHVRGTVDGLRRLGHTVSVFTPNTGGLDENTGSEGVYPVPLAGLAGEAVRLLGRDMPEPAHLVKEWRALMYSEYAQTALLSTLSSLRPGRNNLCPGISWLFLPPGPKREAATVRRFGSLSFNAWTSALSGLPSRKATAASAARTSSATASSGAEGR